MTQQTHGSRPVDSDPAFGASASLPYSTAGNPTTGAAASGPSAERAVREATDGTASVRQGRILGLLSNAGTVGMTWREIASVTGDHHGQVSGALSSLHKQDRVAVLRDARREKSGVYVLPTYVQGRATRAFAGRIAQSDAELMAATLERGGIPTGTGVHQAVEAQAALYARGSQDMRKDGSPTQFAPAPVRAPRLVLSADEEETVKRARLAVRDYADKGSMVVRPSTVKTLLDLIARAR